MARKDQGVATLVSSSLLPIISSSWRAWLWTEKTKQERLLNDEQQVWPRTVCPGVEACMNKCACKYRHTPNDKCQHCVSTALEVTKKKEQKKMKWPFVFCNEINTVWPLYNWKIFTIIF